MQWDPELECGVEIVDNEHKQLIKMVDDLLEAGRTPEASSKALDFLGEYVVSHFAHEEELMAECDYPNSYEHKEIHAKFVMTFLELKTMFDASGGSESVIIEINQAAVSWLFNHIMKTDKEFTKYYKAHSKKKEIS